MPKRWASCSAWATGSRVPHQSLHRSHAASVPDASRAVNERRAGCIANVHARSPSTRALLCGGRIQLLFYGRHADAEVGHAMSDSSPFLDDADLGT